MKRLEFEFIARIVAETPMTVRAREGMVASFITSFPDNDGGAFMDIACDYVDLDQTQLSEAA